VILLWCSSCLEVLFSNEEGPPLIGGEEGAFGKCFIPMWKVPNRPPSTLNLGDTTILTLGKAVSINQPSLMPNGASGGAAAPWATPFWPIFVGLPLVFSWTWPMVVFCEDKVVCLEFGLVLHSFCHTPIKGQYRVHTSYVLPRNSRTHKPTN
jgi:hypothetical protein